MSDGYQVVVSDLLSMARTFGQELTRLITGG
jgi:hypothetical protein